MTPWIVMFAVGLGTYGLRASMFVVLGRRSLPAWTTDPMSFVAPAAIAALTASMLFTSGGAIEVPPVAELGAVAAGFAAVRRSGNVAHAFAAGLPVFWLLSALVG